MSNRLKASLLLSAAALSVVGVWLWKQTRKNRTYVKVGKVVNLFFFPVKSLKAISVTNGKCSKIGFEVNGLYDRSFMVITEENVLLSQREAPTLCFLEPHISDDNLTISGPGVEDLKVKIRNSVTPDDKILECRIFTDGTKVVDCGDEAATWFQNYLNLPGVRLVHYMHELPVRKYLRKDPYFAKVRKENPIAFQDFAPFNILSQASIDDLNSKLEEKVSVYNFRPNILVDECEAFAEDSWKFMKFSSGAEISNILPCSRCILTTNNPETGVLTKKEPLVTLRKYRIPKDPVIAKILNKIPCLAVNCSLWKAGDISVGDEVWAVVE